MGKRAEQEADAIRLYAEGNEIPAISTALGVSENSLRKWKNWAGTEWDDARALARKSFVQSFEDVGARLRRSREITDRLSGDLKTQGDMGQIINGALRTMMYDVLNQMSTADILDPETMSATIDQLNRLTLMLNRAEAAAERNRKTAEEIRKKALEDAADAVEKAAVQQGMNPEQAAFWRQQVLGVQ